MESTMCLSNPANAPRFFLARMADALKLRATGESTYSPRLTLATPLRLRRRPFVLLDPRIPPPTTLSFPSERILLIFFEEGFYCDCPVIRFLPLERYFEQLSGLLLEADHHVCKRPSL